jgi:hypothetical protein
MNTAWRLLEIERVMSENPDTFNTPPLELRMDLNVGDLVRVTFESLKPGYVTEHLWCLVYEVYGPGKYAGTVHDTSVMNPNLPKGANDPFLFEAKHVISMVNKTLA